MRSAEAASPPAGLPELPFPDACFDLVWSSAVLHHVAALEQAVGELVCVARPGGLVSSQSAEAAEGRAAYGVSS